MDSYSKVKEQLKNLRPEFEEFKVNLSAVANVTENDTTTTTNEDIEDKPNGNGHQLSISVGSTLGLIFMIIDAARWRLAVQQEQLAKIWWQNSNASGAT